MYLTIIIIKKLFAYVRYDRDNNGEISRKEMEKVLRSIFELAGEKDKMRRNEDAKIIVNNLFVKFDKNNDGIISEEEFINGCLQDSTLLSLIQSY
jgi:Ca2+-binding EF-hand superfamily protein